MKKRYGNIRIPQKFVLVVKDDQGNEKMIDDDDTDLEAENLKLKKQIEEVQVENAKLQCENNRLFDENRFFDSNKRGLLQTRMTIYAKA
ncbi:hypothetical protein GLOIN_2v1788274 [Rhizophagus irregularis DAOM 181602=DAOM 197198]|nr:hypothetical protein GLOIN_2v1788274 [Rhizophagus irregularis DAOM 181602=DAOM 197198]